MMITNTESMGFHFHEDYIKDNDVEFNSADFNKFRSKILDSDLRKQPFVKPYFPTDQLHTLSEPELKRNNVLQIVSVVNVSESIRKQMRNDGNTSNVYRIVVTDGHNKATCISTQHIPNLNVETPPGTKFHYLGGIVLNGYLFLSSDNFKYLGGKVNYLYEAFIANQNAQRLRLIKGNDQTSSNDKKSLKVSSSSPPVFEPLLTNSSPTATKPITHNKKTEKIANSDIKNKSQNINGTTNATNNNNIKPPIPPNNSVAKEVESIQNNLKNLEISSHENNNNNSSRVRGRGSSSSRGGHHANNNKPQQQQANNSSTSQRYDKNENTGLQKTQTKTYTDDENNRKGGRNSTRGKGRGERERHSNTTNQYQYNTNTSKHNPSGYAYINQDSPQIMSVNMMDFPTLIETKSTTINTITTTNNNTAATTNNNAANITNNKIITSNSSNKNASTTATNATNVSNTKTTQVQLNTSGKPWMCQECTFSNNPCLTYCEMCEQPRRR